MAEMSGKCHTGKRRETLKIDNQISRVRLNKGARKNEAYLRQAYEAECNSPNLGLFKIQVKLITSLKVIK